MFFLLKKVSIDQASRICIGSFVEGDKVDQGTEEKDLVIFVAADHDSSVSEPFPTTNCQDSFPQYQNR